MAAGLFIELFLTLVRVGWQGSGLPALFRHQQLINLFEFDAEQAVETIFQLNLVASG
jgi:hypothetical protein